MGEQQCQKLCVGGAKTSRDVKAGLYKSIDGITKYQPGYRISLQDMILFLPQLWVHCTSELSSQSPHSIFYHRSYLLQMYLYVK